MEGVLARKGKGWGGTSKPPLPWSCLDFGTEVERVEENVHVPACGQQEGR